MITEQRDIGFWRSVAEHPEVAPHVLMGRDDAMPALAEFVAHDSVLPLAAEHGGFIFARLDGLGRVYELHTLFRPEAWGRDVVKAAHEAFAILFGRGAELVVTYELADWWRSRPPVSHGWAPTGDFSRSPELAADVRTWRLDRAAWNASPARRRHCRSQYH